MIGITGYRGYIGSELCQKLAEENREFVGIDIVEGDDIVDRNTLQRKFRNTNSIVHLAAVSGVSECEENPLKSVRTNIRGTVEIAKFCAEKNIRLIFASSFATERNNLYGETKRIGEEVIREICDDYLILKMSNIYGGDKKAVLNFFIDRWDKEETLTVHSPGGQVRDFIHLSDVVDGYICALESNYVGKIPLVSGEVVTVKELADMISDDVEIVEGGEDNEVFHLETSPSRLNKIDFQPKISLDEGIEMMKNEKSM